MHVVDVVGRRGEHAQVALLAREPQPLVARWRRRFVAVGPEVAVILLGPSALEADAAEVVDVEMADGAVRQLRRERLPLTVDGVLPGVGRSGLREQAPQAAVRTAPRVSAGHLR